MFVSHRAQLVSHSAVALGGTPARQQPAVHAAAAAAKHLGGTRQALPAPCGSPARACDQSAPHSAAGRRPRRRRLRGRRVCWGGLVSGMSGGRWLGQQSGGARLHRQLGVVALAGAICAGTSRAAGDGRGRAREGTCCMPSGAACPAGAPAVLGPGHALHDVVTCCAPRWAHWQRCRLVPRCTSCPPCLRPQR